MKFLAGVSAGMLVVGTCGYSADVTGFDSGRFGDATASTPSLYNANTLEPITVSIGDDGAYKAETDTLGVDVTNSPAGVSAIYNAANQAGEGIDIDETQHGLGLAGGTGGLKAGVNPTYTSGATQGSMSAKTDAAKTADTTSKDVCGMSQADAKKLGTDGAALDAFTKGKGVANLSGACRTESQAKLAACGAGDFDKAKAMTDKVDSTCGTPDAPPDYTTKDPISKGSGATIANAAGALAQPMATAQNAIAKALGLATTGTATSGLLNANGTLNFQNILSQIGQTMLTQALSKVMGLATGSTTTTNSDGSTTTTTKNANGTTTVTTQSLLGAVSSYVVPSTTTTKNSDGTTTTTTVNADGSTSTSTTALTCDSVKSTVPTQQVETIGGATVTTAITTDTCNNGNTRVQTVITVTNTDGSTTTQTNEAVHQ